MADPIDQLDSVIHKTTLGFIPDPPDPASLSEEELQREVDSLPGGDEIIESLMPRFDDRYLVLIYIVTAQRYATSWWEARILEKKLFCYQLLTWMFGGALLVTLAIQGGRSLR